MRGQKDNFAYISHIYDAIRKITAYTQAHDYDYFLRNEWDQSAIIRCFEIIGEASTKIEPEFKGHHPEIEWRDIADFRNFLIHDYVDVDIKIVWETMTINIPPLQKKIETILLHKKI